MGDSTAEVFSAAKFARRAEESGLATRDLAARLEVHPATLRAVRSGRSAPSTDLLVKMVETLGGSPADYLDLPERQLWSLKLFRMAAGFTQRGVSEALAVAPAAVSCWETGRYRPPRSALPRLAELYGASEVELEVAVGRLDVATPTEALVLCAASVVSFAEVACEAVAVMPAGPRRVNGARVRAQLEVSIEALARAVPDLPEGDERGKVVEAVRRLAELHATTKT